MRPVQRGSAPNKAFKEHRDAFDELKKRIGQYCSYCERRLPTHLAIEHMQPQSKMPGRALDWENFLLACCNCNSCKGHRAVDLDDYLWPDRHNTLLAFSYRNGQVKNILPPAHPAHDKADALITLMGLDKYPGHPDRARHPTSADERWRERMENYDKAVSWRQRLPANDTPQLRAAIVDVALGFGGFSIWFEVFQHDADMCQRLITAFAGTAADCFKEGKPQNRPGAIL